MRSIVTTFGIKEKKEVAADKSTLDNQASKNQAIADTITNV